MKPGVMICAICFAESPAFATQREGRRWLAKHREKRHPERRSLPPDEMPVQTIDLSRWPT